MSKFDPLIVRWLMLERAATSLEKGIFHREVPIFEEAELSEQNSLRSRAETLTNQLESGLRECVDDQVGRTLLSMATEYGVVRGSLIFLIVRTLASIIHMHDSLLYEGILLKEIDPDAAKRMAIEVLDRLARRQKIVDACLAVYRLLYAYESPVGITLSRRIKSRDEIKIK
jgi:hypothetical protein